jgi:hypothetical protein
MWWIVATAAVVLASQLVVIPGLRWWAGAVAIVLAFYVAIRVIAIAWYERDQHRFEQRWLTDQSALLASHAFEVIRFTAVRGLSNPVDQTYDLADPGDIADLLHRQLNEPTSVVKIEFVRSSPDSEGGVIEYVRRELRQIEIVAVRGMSPRARVRFPEGRYVARPPQTKRDLGRPGKVTFWLLPGPLYLIVRAPDDVSGGTVSGGRSDSAGKQSLL